MGPTTFLLGKITRGASFDNFHTKNVPRFLVNKNDKLHFLGPLGAVRKVLVVLGGANFFYGP